jgi:hypothetical protein
VGAIENIFRIERVFTFLNIFSQPKRGFRILQEFSLNFILTLSFLQNFLSQTCLAKRFFSFSENFLSTRDKNYIPE